MEWISSMGDIGNSTTTPTSGAKKWSENWWPYEMGKIEGGLGLRGWKVKNSFLALISLRCLLDIHRIVKRAAAIAGWSSQGSWSAKRKSVTPQHVRHGVWSHVVENNQDVNADGKGSNKDWALGLRWKTEIVTSQKPSGESVSRKWELPTGPNIQKLSQMRTEN